MTVQELIDSLQSLKDKSLEVCADFPAYGLMALTGLQVMTLAEYHNSTAVYDLPNAFPYDKKYLVITIDHEENE